MKKILLLGCALIISGAIVAQKIQLKKGLRSAKPFTEQKIGIEPEKTTWLSPIKPAPSKTKATSIVNVISLGTSANANSYGYYGGQKTMVWADDTLGSIINIHRMGPGSTPPSLSGYLAVDKAINQGQSVGDWTNNWEIYNAVLNTGATYYLDAARYPQAAIYNPSGNTDPDESYVVYFAPNTSNVASGATWGGYSFGRAKFGTQSDSTKNLRWYNPPPYQYIPDGFELTQKGIALMTDVDQDWSSGSVVYQNNLIFARGAWNTLADDFEYEFSTIPCVTADGSRPTNERIAASPDGNYVWIVALMNNGDAEQIGDYANYYPVLFQSVDAGLNWSNPIAVQLDGPNGIDGIKNGLSDYRLEQLYGSVPNRDEIPYTTAFDVDLVVDKWGNPHIGVVVGITGDQQDYSIITGDSNCIVYDIYSLDDGNSWCAQKMGSLRTFDGTFGTDFGEYNRTQIASNEAGDHVFLTWLDTHVEGVTDNQEPDVFARGFNLIENKITSNDGEDNSNNVTYLSDVYQQAYFQCTSHYVFTKTGGGHIIPIVTELLSDPADNAQPVEFKYISDFSYLPEDYTISVSNPPFPVGINDNKTDQTLTGQIFPNPLRGTGTMTVNLKQSGNLVIEITNMVGQKAMSFNKGYVNSGSQQFTIDASGLQAGVYFYTIKLDDQKYTNKVVVK